MIVNEYVKAFEKLGFGLFVHFGPYSLLGSGEWTKECNHVPDEEYEAVARQFNPSPAWAKALVGAAKSAGCRYITLTTRHHDGFSLFDTHGLSDYDAPHTCGRDLVREFVEECRAQGILPFFYHTLLDWHEKTFRTDFPEYLRYLRDSVELLCKNYGKIGGLWFDGTWSRPEDDWEEDALYGLIRRYQPEAMIINNTGLSARGALGHPELDSVTFERGLPQPINLEDSPKYIASEMNQTMCDHWGYAKEDVNYKAVGSLIEDLANCRKYGSNFLLNVGPKGDGTLRSIDAAILETIGEWVALNDEAIRAPRPTGIAVAHKPKNFVLRDGNKLYLFCFGLPMSADPNVAPETSALYEDDFSLEETARSAVWLDDGSPVEFHQGNGRLTVKTGPFRYGKSLVVRVAKIVVE